MKEWLKVNVRDGYGYMDKKEWVKVNVRNVERKEWLKSKMRNSKVNVRNVE